MAGSQPTLEAPLASSCFGCPADPCTQHRCASSCGERSTTWTAHSPHFRAFCLASSISSVGTAAQTSENLAGNVQTPCSGGTGRSWTQPSRLPCPRRQARPPCATAGPQEVVCRVLKTVDRCKFVSVVHLPDKVVFRGRRPAREHDIQVDFVGYFPPQSLEAELELASVGEEVNRIPIRNVREGEELLVARSSSFLGVGVEPRVQSRPSQLSVAFGASARHSVSLNCDPRQAGSREEQEGVEAAVGFVPQAITSAGVAARESGRADPCKPVTSSGAWTLMTCSKHSFYTRKVDPEHCPMESSKRWSPE